MKPWLNSLGLTVRFCLIRSDAGRYVQVPAGIAPKPGEGGRHLAARSISQLAESIAICVSSAGIITLYSMGKERYRVRLS